MNYLPKKKYCISHSLTYLILTFLVLAVYWPALFSDFVDYDDGMYIYRNSEVAGGISWHSLKWALKDTSTGIWHPLTWLSHLVDVSLFGMNPKGHHFKKH